MYQMFSVHRKNLKTQQWWPVLLDFCLRKTLSGKSRGHSDVIGFEKLRVENVLRPCENEKPAFSHSSGLEKNSIFRGGNFEFWSQLNLLFQQVIAFAESALLPGMSHSGDSDDTYNSCFNTQLVQANGQNLLDLKRWCLIFFKHQTRLEP